MAPPTMNGSVFVVQTMQEAVVEHLRKLILSGKYAPGQRLIQDELAEELGISRTPVREALTQLAHQGLVVISSYKGASVAKFSVSNLMEIYTVRIALESYATYLAAGSITDGVLEQLEEKMKEMGEAFHHKEFEHLLGAHHQFHANIYYLAGKQRLSELTIRYLELSNVYQRMALSIGRGANDPIKEHVDILETLRSRDAEASCRLMRAHLELTMGELSDILKE